MSKMPKDSATLPGRLNSLQRPNYARALELWHDEALMLDSHPTIYQVDFGRECNLNCIMCPQTEVRKSFSRGHKHSRLLESLHSQYDIMAKAEKVIVFGGEPLFIPESREFIQDFLTEPRLDDVELHLVTNGILLHEFFEDMKQKRRLLISLSIDALANNYERIRRGAKWERLLKNLKDFAALRASARSGWVFRINTVIMRNSVADLRDLARMAVDLGADTMSFTPLTLTRRTSNENILNLPIDSEEFKRCKRQIEDVIFFLESKGKSDWCAGLHNILLQMGSEPLPKADTCKDVLLDNKLLASLSEKKVMIWGTGSYYRIWLADWLQRHRDRFDFLGFVDNDPLRWEQQLDGYSILSPESLHHIGGLDYILVANSQVDAVRRQVAGMGLDTKVL